MSALKKIQLSFSGKPTALTPAAQARDLELDFTRYLEDLKQAVNFLAALEKDVKAGLEKVMVLQRAIKRAERRKK